MQKMIKPAFLLLASLALLTSCGGGSKDKKGAVGDLKVKLEKKKKEKNDLEVEIHGLEEQINKLDPQSAQAVQKLVSVDTLRTSNFTHFIELQGKIDASDIVYVAPRGMPATVKFIYVKRGDRVSKGQLLAKLDDAIMLQQVDGLKTQLAYAQDLYNRQKNLWDQGIGTEVQLITAKNNVDGINKQIATMMENWKTSFVYAPISGVADEVNVRVGEVFNGGNSNSPQIKLVNGNSLKVVAEVPENYIAKVRQGDKVEVEIPEIGKAPFQTSINMIGATIHPTNRSFTAEAKLPSDPLLKPNQTAIMKILDYQAKSTIAVPVNVVQSDEKGKYVYLVQKEGNKLVAKKRPVDVGEAYNGMIEIKSGLSGGEVIITEGYQLVYDGQAVTTGS